jgi:hypothetical protein
MTTAMMTLRHDSRHWVGPKTGIEVPRTEFRNVLYLSISVNTKTNKLIRGGGGGGEKEGRLSWKCDRPWICHWRAWQTAERNFSCADRYKYGQISRATSGISRAIPKLDIQFTESLHNYSKNKPVTFFFSFYFNNKHTSPNKAQYVVTLMIFTKSKIIFSEFRYNPARHQLNTNQITEPPTSGRLPILHYY